jgi:hypothetical protein
VHSELDRGGHPKIQDQRSLKAQSNFENYERLEASGSVWKRLEASGSSGHNIILQMIKVSSPDAQHAGQKAKKEGNPGQFPATVA